MVPDLARMSVIIKSQHETSVMTGNYEMGYACGLLCKLAGREVPQWETPVELKDRVAELLTGYEPANEREKNVIHMLHYYHPDETADEQVKELIGWGYDEQRLWQMRITVRVLNSYENLRLQPKTGLRILMRGNTDRFCLSMEGPSPCQCRCEFFTSPAPADHHRSWDS